MIWKLSLEWKSGMVKNQDFEVSINHFPAGIIQNSVP